MDPYVKFDWAGRTWQTEVHTDAGKSPVWNQLFKLPVLDLNCKETVKFVLKDKELLGDDDMIGEASYEFSRLQKVGLKDVPVLFKNKICGKLFWKVGEFEEANLEDMLKEWDEAAAIAAGFGDMIKSATEAVKPSPINSSKKNNKKNKRTNSKVN